MLITAVPQGTAAADRVKREVQKRGPQKAAGKEGHLKVNTTGFTKRQDGEEGEPPEVKG